MARPVWTIPLIRMIVTGGKVTATGLIGAVCTLYDEDCCLDLL